MFDFKIFHFQQILFSWDWPFILCISARHDEAALNTETMWRLLILFSSFSLFFFFRGNFEASRVFFFLRQRTFATMDDMFSFLGWCSQKCVREWRRGKGEMEGKRGRRRNDRFFCAMAPEKEESTASSRAGGYCSSAALLRATTSLLRKHAHTHLSSSLLLLGSLVMWCRQYCSAVVEENSIGRADRTSL